MVLLCLILVTTSQIIAERVLPNREEPLLVKEFRRCQGYSLCLAIVVIADGVFDSLCVEDPVQLSLDFNAFEAEASLQIVPKHSVEEV